jgi:cysteine-rich repeat protein
MTRATLGGVIGLMAAIAVPPVARGAANPAKAARKCRGVIGTAIKQVTQVGLARLDACHAKRDKGKTDADCNGALASDANYGRIRMRATGMIGAACPPGNPVLVNYTSAGVAQTVLPEVTDVLTASGMDVQGLPVILSDRTGRAMHAKCHKAIGKARSAIVKEIVKRSLACQKRLDKKATTFAGLDPQCRIASAGSAGRVAGGIAKKCGGLTGADVGSCTALPDCVVAEATASGQAIAANVYGAFICGDGVREGAEECDDGNTDDADGCTNACTLPACGDGVVQPGEQCDDGKPAFNDDACKNDCTLPVCGDGILSRGVEECEDGNTIAGDGCSPDCKLESVTCGADGAQVTIILDYDVNQLSTLQGVGVNLGYPEDRASLPGSGAQAAARITDLVNLGLLAPNDKDTNGNGIEDTLAVLYASTPSTLPPGNFVRVQFDCPAGDVLEPFDFPCVVSDASDAGGNQVSDLVHCTVRLASSAPSTTTTVTTPATTSSTGTTGTTTSSTTLPHVCGNGTVEGSETCDDGNAIDENDPSTTASMPDTCPANCTIGACGAGSTTSQDVSVNFAVPPGSPAVGGITVFLDYPDTQTSIPGSGSGVSGSIKNLPPGSLPSPNDLDYGLLEGVVNISWISPGRLFTVTFANCPGAPPLQPGDFHCVVKDTSDTGGNDLAGATCSVTIP